MQQERPGAPLPFKACENFRELGGYTGCGGRHVKYGAFYRSPALANIKTPADRARFEALGVRTVFDFRSEKERTLAPDPDFPGVVNIPASAMLAEDGSEVDFDLEKLLRSEDGIRMLTEGVHESYARMPFGNPAYRALFGAIRAGQTPILFHCTAGGPHGRGGGAHPQGAGRFPGGYRGGLSIDQCLPHHGAGPVPRNAGAGGTARSAGAAGDGNRHRRTAGEH